MRISNECNDNRTYKLLAPALKYYGREFEQKVNNTFKFGFAIGDAALEAIGKVYNNHIFILVQTGTKFFKELKQFLENQSYLSFDYPFDNILTGDKHVFVVDFPEELRQSFELFIEGHYSKMYTEEQINKYFSENLRAKKIFFKDRELKKEFVKGLNFIFNTNISEDEYAGEIVLPVKFSKHFEILNC